MPGRPLPQTATTVFPRLADQKDFDRYDCHIVLNDEIREQVFLTIYDCPSQTNVGFPTMSRRMVTRADPAAM
jgi:hypothetical protein